MGLEQDWRSSRVAYTELVYRPMVRSGYTTRDVGTAKAVQRALTGAALNKIIFALFTMAGSLLPFVLYETRLITKVDITFAVAVSLSILLVFGYVVLYCVQVLPSFVTSGSFTPLTVLPIASRDVSTVAAMTLWRTLDYILVASLVCQLGAIAYLTGSVTGTLLIAFASVSSSVLAVGLALWLTLIFQKRLETGSLSGVRAFFRPLYFILWGLGVMSAVFLFSLISYISPDLVNALAAPASPVGFVLSLVLPFSAGLVSAHFQGEGVTGPSLTLGLAGLVIAAVVSFDAGRVILRVVSGVVLPSREVGGGGRKGGLSFRVRSPLPAYVLKDLRVSSRNPATAFLFALPLFEIFAVVVPLTATQVVRVSVLLVASQVGGGFALFVAFLLVTVEDLGVEKRTALPFSEITRTLSKVFVSTAAYVPVPIVLAVVLWTKQLTFSVGIALPALTTVSVFAGCIIEVSVLKYLAAAGYGAAVRFSMGVGSGGVILLLPAAGYVIEYTLSRGRWASLEVFSAATAFELTVALVLLATRNGLPRSINRATERT